MTYNEITDDPGWWEVIYQDAVAPLYGVQAVTGIDFRSFTRAFREYIDRAIAEGVSPRLFAEAMKGMSHIPLPEPLQKLRSDG